MISVEDFYDRYFSTTLTDKGYLWTHFPRFLETKRRFDSTNVRNMVPLRVLDIGAHWLHQSMLWRSDGHNIIAADIPATLCDEQVISLASKNDVKLVVYDNLESGSALSSIANDSIDVVLFAEILEHITFNPVSFWKEIYRVMAPSSRIVVTTPNYYWARGRFWDIGRFFDRMGGGLTVKEILQTPTYGPHWKEYSLREIVAYFSMLSSDFIAAKAEYVPDPRSETAANGSRLLHELARVAEKTHRLFHWGLHVEVALVKKRVGIEITPSWD